MLWYLFSMGASCWFTTTTYRGDLEEALRRAKREIFQSGQAYDALGIVADPEAAITRLSEATQNISLPAGFPEEDVAEIRESLAAENAVCIRHIRRFVESQDLDQKIEALRQAVGFEGTHTVIDIAGVEGLTQLSREEVVERFGVESPTVDAVREAQEELQSRIDRFSAVWLLADNHGEQVICFIGVSGD